MTACMASLLRAVDNRTGWAIGAAAGLAMALLSWMAHPQVNERLPQELVGTPAVYEGVIVDAPDRRFGRTLYVVRVERLGWRVRVEADPYPRYEEGDALRLHGALSRPMPESYERYLALGNIRALLRPTDIVRTAVGDEWRITTQLRRLRERLEERINRMYPEPHASLLAGLLVGSRRGMPQHIEDDVTAVGLTHIVAVSGSNVTLVATAIFWLLCWLPLRARIICCGLGVAAFAVLTGGGAPVVRATLMGCLGLLALLLGRTTQVRRSIVATLCALTLWHPQRPWVDIGFQLSFLSVLGLAECGMCLAPLLQWLPRTAGLREQVVTTLSAQIATTPWIAWLFGRASLISPLANVLVAPAIPCAMLLGTASLLVGSIWPAGGQLIALAAWAPLEWILRIATTLADLPYASIDVEVGGGSVVVYYAALVLLVHATQRCISTGTSTASCRAPKHAPDGSAQAPSPAG